jgi:hypothetical protein
VGRATTDRVATLVSTTAHNNGDMNDTESNRPAHPCRYLAGFGATAVVAYALGIGGSGDASGATIEAATGATFRSRSVQN